MEIFNPAWLPDWDMTVEEQSEDYLRKVTYGEGAVQLQKKTLGRIPQTYTMTFTRLLTDLNVIDNFVVSQQGKRFLWQPPGESEKIIVYCSKRTKTLQGVSGVLSLTFTQVLY